MRNSSHRQSCAAIRVLRQANKSTQINVVGGFALLSVLRSIAKFHVRSSTNPSLSDSFGSLSKSSSSPDYPKSYVPTASSTSASQNGNDLQRLESDITLVRVPPASRSFADHFFAVFLHRPSDASRRDLVLRLAILFPHDDYSIERTVSNPRAFFPHKLNFPAAPSWHVSGSSGSTARSPRSS